MWTNTNESLVNGVLNYGPCILENCLIDLDTVKQYIDRIDTEYLEYPRPVSTIDPSQWFIPIEYQQLDIEKHCLTLCNTDEQRSRTLYEFELYKKHNMILLLKTIKYIVDTLRANNVLWGVGRGSSVASYVLFLIGIHKIDSIKYNLPIDEFFKGEQDGQNIHKYAR